ncbi:MAG: hypothetical protein K8H86_02515, partial [Ignavibacteriaceae bacterium]|nr:hypothetical protein [Ignavibacteriaceae bacterium]
ALVKELKKTGFKIVYLTGKMMKNVSEKLSSVKNNEVKHFKSRAALKNLLSTIDLMDSVVLVKGSRGMKMEEFVKVLMEREK